MNSNHARGRMRDIARLALAAAVSAATAYISSCVGSSPAGSDPGIPPALAYGSASPEDAAKSGAGKLGLVYGEFEDAGLFRRELGKRPEMASWTAKEIFDGLSGATIQYKTYNRKVAERFVLVDGEIAAQADGFGQFWIELPPGAYTLTGTCKGFKDAEATIDIRPGTKHYLNFFLKR
jgi:hypothetical protein